MTQEQVTKVNGFSPRLWDSGTENDNMQARLQSKQMWPPELPQVRSSLARLRYVDIHARASLILLSDEHLLSTPRQGKTGAYRAC